MLEPHCIFLLFLLFVLLEYTQCLKFFEKKITAVIDKICFLVIPEPLHIVFRVIWKKQLTPF